MISESCRSGVPTRMPCHALYLCSESCQHAPDFSCNNLARDSIHDEKRTRPSMQLLLKRLKCHKLKRSFASGPIYDKSKTSPTKPAPSVPSDLMAMVRDIYANRPNEITKKAAPFKPQYGEQSYLSSSFSPGKSTTPSQHTLHARCSRNNVILTLMSPKQECILRATGGSVGFKKGQRGGYEAGFRAASHMFQEIARRSTLVDPAKRLMLAELEIVFRGFGMARDALIKALTGVEGRPVRGFVRRLTDATRLKYGGTRSRKARRI